jgi:nucleotidyltransferase substrate binding protein (TIGR01987 family)
MASGELGRENLRRALDGLSVALAIATAGYPEFVRDVIDNGRIQKFEYCVELFWKHLRSSLLAEGLDVPNSPKAAIKAGLDRDVVLESEYQVALDMIADRNACSHVYRQAILPVIVGRLPEYARLMQAIAARLPFEC